MNAIKTKFELLTPTPNKKTNWDVIGTYDSVKEIKEAWKSLTEAQEATHVADFVAFVDGGESVRLQIKPTLVLNPER